MGRTLGKVAFFGIDANLSPCAHICRYCQIGDRGGRFPFDRWLKLHERFLDWFEECGLHEVTVSGGFFPSFNFDIETYVKLKEWHQRKRGINLSGIALGGLKMRSEEDMRQWLIERQSIGFKTVIGTFLGHGSIHDQWNGRRGDFDFMMRTLRTAAELGWKHRDHHILTKSSLPLLSETIEKLDTLPTPFEYRTVGSLLYIGHGAHHDDERITEDDLERLPAFVPDHLVRGFVLRSEREWIEMLRTAEEIPKDVSLHLELNSNNIDRLKAMSCDEIYFDLEDRARSSLGAFPSLYELADSYGDRNSTKIYMTLEDMERMWLHRFVDANQVPLDWDLLHLHLGRSFNPPPLWDLGP